MAALSITQVPLQELSFFTLRYASLNFSRENKNEACEYKIREENSTFFNLPHVFCTQKMYKNHEVNQKNSLLHCNYSLNLLK